MRVICINYRASLNEISDKLKIVYEKITRNMKKKKIEGL